MRWKCKISENEFEAMPYFYVVYLLVSAQTQTQTQTKHNWLVHLTKAYIHVKKYESRHYIKKNVKYIT